MTFAFPEPGCRSIAATAATSTGVAPAPAPSSAARSSVRTSAERPVAGAGDEHRLHVEPVLVVDDLVLPHVRDLRHRAAQDERVDADGPAAARGEREDVVGPAVDGLQHLERPPARARLG